MRHGVKDKTLSCKEPDEQELGILLNVKADTPGLKISIE